MLYESPFQVPLQNLLNKTCESIAKILNRDPEEGEKPQLTLVCKMGFDGSSGHSPYKQKTAEGTFCRSSKTYQYGKRRSSLEKSETVFDEVLSAYKDLVDP